MNSKAESVAFVTIVTAALVVIGLLFVIVGKESSVTGQITLRQKACYLAEGDILTPMSLADCCVEIRKSTGCSSYDSPVLKDNLYKCEGVKDIVVNADTISFCE